MVNCHQCDSNKNYKRIARHFASCGYPDIQEDYKEILIGLYLGDATVAPDDGNNKMTIYSTNYEFLSHIISKFPDWLVTTSEPNLFKTKEECQKTGENWLNERGYSGDYDFSEQYRIRTIRHPYFNTFEEWNKNGNKNIPPDTKITTKMIKYWYCCDGTCQRKNNNKYVKISCHVSKKELAKRAEAIERLLDACSSVNPDNNVITLDSTNSKRFLSNLGNPVSGFEYKW